MVSASLKHTGYWGTHTNLVETAKTHPEDLSVRGYLEITRARIVRDLCSRPAGMTAVPILALDFQHHYERYDLSAAEGYLASLIDGVLTVAQLLKVSPFDQFTTLFLLARLEQLKVIAFPS